MKEINYLTFEDVMQIHDKIIEKYWWLPHVKNKGQINSILEHIQNDEYYPTIIDKVVHLFYSLVNFHCFNDWNKRTSLAVLVIFLLANNINITDIIIEFEDVVVDVASWKIKKEELKKKLNSIFWSYWYKI